MALPVSDTINQWPPKALDSILPSMLRWSAWWANSIEMLQIAYGGGTTGDSTGFFASDTGGQKVHSLGPISWFVGKPTTGGERNRKIPIPIAAEICQASADLLFSDPVTVTVGPKDAVTTTEGAAKPENPTQKRLNELLDEGFHSTMAEAAEMAAALGGVYLRATWDDTIVKDAPFSSIMDADMAIPEFAWGRLQAVTFWNVVHRQGKYVYRHLERHEIDPITGTGVILHGLYMGEEKVLGERIPLTSLAAAPGLKKVALHRDIEGAEGTIDTKSEGLAVTYVPNQTPNRIWRKDPIGRHLGRSDLDGIEHLMDQLAENTTDWMRARRAARARVMFSKELAKNGGPGNGTFVNPDQESYIPVNYTGMSGGNDAKLSDMVQVLQPDFDPSGYKVTGQELAEQILQMAGYSMQTFGVNPEGGSGDATATEVEARTQRSLMTKSRKEREWTPALIEHLTKLLNIDNDFFSGHNVISEINVEFADGVQESQIKLGQFVQALYASESASVEERVSILHPDWDATQIGVEVKRIKAEFAPTMTDPGMDPFETGEPHDDEPDPTDK